MDATVLANSALATVWNLECLATVAYQFKKQTATSTSENAWKEFNEQLFPVLDKHVPEFLRNFAGFYSLLRNDTLDAITRVHTGPVHVGDESGESFTLIAWNRAKRFYLGCALLHRKLIVELPREVTDEDLTSDVLAKNLDRLEMCIEEDGWEAIVAGIRNEVLRVRDGTPLGEKEQTPDDDAMMTHADLANLAGISPDAMRKRLDRWRAGNLAGWQEVTEPSKGQPKYLYRVAAVRHLLT